jgi:hypothetical protein
VDNFAFNPPPPLQSFDMKKARKLPSYVHIARPFTSRRRVSDFKPIRQVDSQTGTFTFLFQETSPQRLHHCTLTRHSCGCSRRMQTASKCRVDLHQHQHQYQHRLVMFSGCTVPHVCVRLISYLNASLDDGQIVTCYLSCQLDLN